MPLTRETLAPQVKGETPPAISTVLASRYVNDAPGIFHVVETKGDKVER